MAVDDGDASHVAVPSDLPTLTALPSDPTSTHGPATPAHAPDEDTSADNGHHPIADPKINVTSNAGHNSDDGPAASGGSHPADRQGDQSESAGSKFADDGKSLPPADHGHHANADPEINLLSVAKNHPPQHPADNSLHTPKQYDDSGSPAATDGTHPARGRVDASESASLNLADNGSPHSARATGEDTSVPSAPADHGHHRNADPKNNDIANDPPSQRPVDNSLHAQHDDNGSRAVTGGVHPGHRQVDSSEPTSSISADNGSTHSAHAGGEGPPRPSSPADNGHQPTTDPEINIVSIAPDQPPEHPGDNLPPTPAQPQDGPHPADPPVDVNKVSSFKFADNGSDHGTGPDGVHPAHPQANGNQSDSFKFADGGDHPDKIPNDPPTALTAGSSDSSGTHGLAAPTVAATFDVPAAGTSLAPDQFVFAEKADHDPVAEHKPDAIENAHPLPHDVQQLMDIAHETNSASTPDARHAMALQDAAKVQAAHHQDAFHLA